VLKPWLTTRWCLPPQGSAEFVCQMEDVLAVYHRPYDARFPQVCLDETSKQLVGEVRPPLPPAPGQPAHQDYEYVRNGVANLFLVTEPLRGWRHVTVTDRRTAVDFAHVIKDLVDQRYPDAERIVLVMDNLNTHTPASLYAAFPPTEARRLAEKLELHYTPKHGSWLNMAEIEFSVLGRQCLDQRIADQPSLAGAVALWEAHRNRVGTGVKWRFTTADARIRLHRLYPAISA
jgi:DDE superfamily endonuclease